MTLKMGGKPGLQKTFYKGFDIRSVLVWLFAGVLDGITRRLNHDPVAF